MIHKSIQIAAAAPPDWYLFETTRVAWAANFLEANGVEAWYPTKTMHETRRKQGRQSRVAVTKPVISGYLFAAFRGQPLWHVIKERSAGKIYRVFATNGEPRRFTDAELMQMAQVPHRLEAQKRAMIEARTIRPGDTALHPTMGRVKITGVDGQLAKFIAPLFGGEREVVADVVALEKVV